MAHKRLEGVRISLNWISWLCRERPDVWIWYLSIWERLEAAVAVFRRMATAQILRATLPITVYSGSMPLEKKNDKLGAKGIDIHPPGQVVFHIGEPVGQGQGQLGDGIGPGLCDVIPGNGHRVKIFAHGYR
jgi:hypothetical protein